MRISDLSNLSELVTDRNAVFMQYIGVEVLHCGCFTQIRNKFVLTTPFFGKDSEEVARTTSSHSSYLLIRGSDYHPMDDVKCTTYNIVSVKCVGEKIEFELITTQNNLLSEKDLKNIADKISSTRFKFVRSNVVDGISYNTFMVRVKD